MLEIYMYMFIHHMHILFIIYVLYRFLSIYNIMLEIT